MNIRYNRSSRNYKQSNIRRRFVVTTLIVLAISIGAISPHAVAQLNPEGYTTSDVIQISQNALLQVNTTAPLQWSFGSTYAISVSMVAALSDSAGIVNITLVEFKILNKDSETETTYLEVVNQAINGTLQLNVSKAIDTPDLDVFTVEINILASSNVSQVSTPETNYSVTFPDNDLQITVVRDNLAAILQLPGFPETETFKRWLIVYALIMLLFLLPTGALGIFKYKDSQMTSRLDKPSSFKEENTEPDKGETFIDDVTDPKGGADE